MDAFDYGSVSVSIVAFVIFEKVYVDLRKIAFMYAPQNSINAMKATM